MGSLLHYFSNARIYRLSHTQSALLSSSEKEDDFLSSSFSEFFKKTETYIHKWSYSQKNWSNTPSDLLSYILEQRLRQNGEKAYLWVPTLTEISTFLKDTKKVLPHYSHFFISSGEKTGIDWRILAALAYQESHWKQSAKSPTGVRGFMQITERTAKQLSIKNRRSIPEQIAAAATYLSSIKKSLHGSENEKLRHMIAAYNGGPTFLKSYLETESRTLPKKVRLWGSLPGKAKQARLTVEKVEVYYLLLQKLEPSFI